MANNSILELFTLCGNLKLYTRKEYKKKTIYFDITFTDLPQKLKRYKGSTKTTSLDKAKKIALLKVNSEYEKRKLYGVRSTQTPILQYLPKYYDWCLQQVENKATLKHKSGVRRWTANKAIHDKRGLEKYFVPFIKKNNINWSTLQQDKTMDKWVDVLRLHIADTSIQRYKGAINAYMGIVNTISKIENKDWLKKSLKKQERNKKTLYRTLNRHIEELVAVYVQFIDKKSMLSL